MRNTVQHATSCIIAARLAHEVKVLTDWFVCCAAVPRSDARCTPSQRSWDAAVSRVHTSLFETVCAS